MKFDLPVGEFVKRAKGCAALYFLQRRLASAKGEEKARGQHPYRISRMAKPDLFPSGAPSEKDDIQFYIPN